MELRGERVLVTGGAGFIGSELVRQLLAKHCQVTVVDNLVNGRRENLAGLEAELRVCDICDTGIMRHLLRGIDRLFHLACLGVRHSIHSPLENHEVNATATLNLLAAARAAGVRRFVYVSSSEVYGTARVVPLTEESPTVPQTVYGASKLAGDGYTRAYYETFAFPTVVVRPFNAYGPRCHHEGDSGEVIPKFLLRCMAGYPMIIFGDGTQTRDFTYVADIAAGILAAGFSDAAIGQTVNLGSGCEIMINDLAQIAASVAGRTDAKVIHVEPRPGDVLRLRAGAARACELLGWRPRVSFAEGLALLKAWYLRQGQSPEVLLEREVVHNWAARSTHAA